MSESPTLDFEGAQAAADAGIATSDEHALAEWKRAADGVIFRLAVNRDEFTADDVWALGLDANPTGSNTALGARFRAAAREGTIINTGRTTKTAQVQSHGQPVTVWRSLLRRPTDHACPTCEGSGRVDTATLRSLS